MESEQMESERRAYLLAILDQMGDRRDVNAREEDNSIIFPSSFTPRASSKQQLLAISVAEEPVLGCFLTEGLMDAFKQLIDRTYRGSATMERIPVVFQPTENATVNQEVTDQLSDLISDARRFHSSTCIYENRLGLRIYIPRRLDFRMDLCEEFTVPETDPRIQLRGQLGLRAKTYIQMHTVLGVYRGLILPRYVTDHNLVQNPRQGWRRTVKEWEHEIRRYMMETDLHIVNPTTGTMESIPLDISPYGYNNPGGLINDPRILPDDTDHARDPYLSGERIRFSTDGHEEVVITVRPLIAGQELLYNYGRDHFLQPGHFPSPDRGHRLYQE